jgi:putative Mg2+ transporter-C (MgtC) family protein
MEIWLADSLFGGPAQGARHLIELFAAFGLTALVGLERTVQGKSAGLRTQTIVGTSSALVLLISKYGFSDVLSPQSVVLDPSRVAAQIVSGIGFLGAAIIITRRGAVHGLYHGGRRRPAVARHRGRGPALCQRARVQRSGAPAHSAAARDGPGAHHLPKRCWCTAAATADLRGQRKWQLTELDADPHDIERDQVGVTMTLSGAKIATPGRCSARLTGLLRCYKRRRSRTDPAKGHSGGRRRPRVAA